MFTNDWVKIEFTDINLATKEITCKVLRESRDGMSYLMTSGAESYINAVDVVSITRCDDDDTQENQTTLDMNKAGLAIEVLSMSVIQSFDRIMETLPCDYDDLFEQLVDQVKATQLKGSPAKG